MRARIKELARKHPTFGYRRLWALLRHGDGLVVNIKKVHRLVKSMRLGQYLATERNTSIPKDKWQDFDSKSHFKSSKIFF